MIFAYTLSVTVRLGVSDGSRQKTELAAGFAGRKKPSIFFRVFCISLFLCRASGLHLVSHLELRECEILFQCGEEDKKLPA